MKTKLDIFILREVVQAELIDSFSHNNCNVRVFTTVEDMLTSAIASPSLIILDDPISALEKQRAKMKLDQMFPMTELVYLPKLESTTKMDALRSNVTKKSTVAMDEMLYFLTYKERFDTDTLIVNSIQNKAQQFFVPVALTLLATVLLGALYVA